jgi:ATP-dependent helicase/nuclease subunit A
MRILYVAMTRAKRRLILTACLGKPEEKLQRAPLRPTAWNVLKAGSPVLWLMMGPRTTLAVTVHEREPYLSGGAETKRLELPPADPQTLKEIESNLNWTYEYGGAVRLGAKAAVSRIGRDETTAPQFNAPAFLGARENAAFAGTATHTAMQYLPLEQEPDADEIRAYLIGLTGDGRLTKEQADAVDTDAVAWFLQTPLFNRMKTSGRLERELTFSYPIAASALYDVDSDERVLLQGIMDACFREADGWTLVDYKTDRVRPGESAWQAAQRHTTQLHLYALALEALTGERVKEKLVVMLSHRAVVEL